MITSGTQPALKSATSRAQPWRQELEDLVRGLAGGFLFGIPLLYTMEVWWIGTYAEPWRLLLLLLLAFLVNCMLSRFSGFRKGAPPASVFTDALEALALGVVAAGMTMLVLGEIGTHVPLNVIVGKIVLESVPFSLGVSIANGFLSGNKEQPQGGNDAASPNEGEDTEDTGAGEADAEEDHDAIHGTLLDAGATVAGALFISFSIAPTEEVPMLVGNLQPWGLSVLILFSLVVSYIITFEAGFADQAARQKQEGIFQRPLSETIFSYLLSLLVAAVLLWVFRQLAFSDPWQVWLGQIVVLGLPATIGGSAGRLAVGG